MPTPSFGGHDSLTPEEDFDRRVEALMLRDEHIESLLRGVAMGGKTTEPPDRQPSVDELLSL